MAFLVSLGNSPPIKSQVIACVGKLVGVLEKELTYTSGGILIPYENLLQWFSNANERVSIFEGLKAIPFVKFLLIK